MREIKNCSQETWAINRNDWIFNFRGMYNLKFSPHALGALQQFKKSADVFPSDDLFILFVDLHQIWGGGDAQEAATREAYGLFYSHKKHKPEYRAFAEHFEKKMGEYGVERIKVAVSPEAPPDANIDVHPSRRADCKIEEHYFVARGNLTPRTGELVRKFRSTFEKELAVYYKTTMAASVSVEAPSLGKAEVQAKAAGGETLLGYFTAKRGPREKSIGGLNFGRAAVRYGHRFLGRVDTVRKAEQMIRPTKMVFYKHHCQVRPPYYNKAGPSRSKAPRNSLRRILGDEEYEYNSDEEWVEEEGESVGTTESEEYEEEEGEHEWIEESKDESLLKGTHLPTMDFPQCEYQILANSSGISGPK